MQTFKPIKQLNSFHMLKSDVNAASGFPEFAELSVLVIRLIKTKICDYIIYITGPSGLSNLYTQT